MANLISRIKANAVGRNKSAVTTMTLIADSVVNLNAGDWTPLAWIVSLAEGADKSRLSRIIEAVYGVTFKSDPKQPTGIRGVMPEMGGANSYSVGSALCAEYAGAGFGFRSKSLETGFGDVPAILVKKETTFDLKARSRSLIKAALEAGFEMGDIRNVFVEMADDLEGDQE